MNPFEMPDGLLLHVNDELKGLEILFLGLVFTRLYKITSLPLMLVLQVQWQLIRHLIQIQQILLGFI